MKNRRCVLLYSPVHSEIVVALRRRGIDARQCFELSEVIDHLLTDAVCAVVLAGGADSETDVFAARALERRHPEVTLVAIGRAVEGVALHLTWPLPAQAVFLDWLQVEGAPLHVNEEETERNPFEVFTDRAKPRSSIVDDLAETTLAEGELDTLIDALETEVLGSADASTRLRLSPG